MRFAVSIFKVALSLGLGAAICFGLMFAGVIRPHWVAPVVSSPALLTQVPSPTPQTSIKTADRTKGSFRGATPLSADDDVQQHLEKVDDGLVSKSPIYAKVVEYLNARGQDAPGDAEGQLRRYLTDQLDQTPEQADRLVRISFWKNFVTLAEPWTPDDWPHRLAEFQNELALKSAGFKALGLQLMPQTREEAEAFAQDLMERAKGSAAKEDAP